MRTAIFLLIPLLAACPPAFAAFEISLDSEQQDTADYQDALQRARKAISREDFSTARDYLDQAEAMGMNHAALEEAETLYRKKKRAKEQRLAEQSRREEAAAASQAAASAGAGSSGVSGSGIGYLLLQTGSWCGEGALTAQGVNGTWGSRDLDCCGWGSLGASSYSMASGTYRISFNIRTCGGTRYSGSTGEIPIRAGETTRLNLSLDTGNYWVE